MNRAVITHMLIVGMKKYDNFGKNGNSLTQISSPKFPSSMRQSSCLLDSSDIYSNFKLFEAEEKIKVRKYSLEAHVLKQNHII